MHDFSSTIECIIIIRTSVFDLVISEYRTGVDRNSRTHSTFCRGLICKPPCRVVAGPAMERNCGDEMPKDDEGFPKRVGFYGKGRQWDMDS